MALGHKTGGRKKGTPNKATAKRQAAIEASGLTPLDYMLSIMRDEERDATERLEAAKAAAPFVHPRLSTVQSDVNVTAKDDSIAGLRERIALNDAKLHERQ